LWKPLPQRQLQKVESTKVDDNQHPRPLLSETGSPIKKQDDND
jgi:hypothetical protein